MRQDISGSLGILQANLVSNLKTNNLILDLILGIVIMSFVSKFMDNFFRFDLIDKINKYINHIFPKKRKNEIILIRKEFISTNLFKGKNSYPKNILAIYNYIHKHNLLENGSMTFVEHRQSLTRSDINFVINSKEPIKLCDDIFFKKLYSTDGEMITENNKGEKTLEHKYALYSNNKSLAELRNFLNDIIENLNKDMIYDLNKKLTYYIFDRTCDESNIFDEYPLENDRSFENVFFDEKMELKNRLDFFLNNREWYKQKGIPYTLGIMFSGKPGCGKTSTIKAIAKYTNRHIIDVPLSKIESCRDLMNIFYKEEINEKVVPMNKRIYLFEDIDSILDILKDRELQEKKEKTDSEKLVDKTNEFVNNLNLITKKCSVIKPNKDKLNLGFFLNLIDGVLETPGRILIISTNYPEKLDRALVRPGRIDIKIHLEKCSRNVIRDILEHYYGLRELLKETSDKLSNIIESFYLKEITPAELYLFCFKHSSIDKMIETFEIEGFENIFNRLINRDERFEFNKSDLLISRKNKKTNKLCILKKRDNESEDNNYILDYSSPSDSGEETDN